MFLLLLASFASYRLTRVVTTDGISESIRRRLGRRLPASTAPLYGDDYEPIPGAAKRQPHWLVVLVNCNACIGWWIAGGMVAAAHMLEARALPWLWALFAWPAVAGLAFLLGEIDERLGR